MADFWWNSCEHSRKIHWQSWEKLCLPKNQGGLGFRNIQRFNQALLAKQSWRILQSPECLMAKIMKSRYFPNSDFLSAPMGNRPSFAWRSVMHGRCLLEKGIVKKVGKGDSIKVWTDPWIEDEGMRAPWRKKYFFDVNLKVADLIDKRLRDWDSVILEENFFPGDIARIKAIKPVVSQEDFFVWKYNKSGDFSVKSAYWLTSQLNVSEVMLEALTLPSTNDLKSQVWDLHTDPKLKVFLWKVLSGAMPVAEALNGRGMNVDVRCQNCGMEGENIMHVLFSCSYARQVWALSDFPSPQSGFQEGSVFSNIHHLLVNRGNRDWPLELRRSFPWILWRIWTNRNSFLFEGKLFSALETVEKIREDVMEWTEAQCVELVEESCVENTRVKGKDQVVNKELLKWLPPPINWLKCNLGTLWSKSNKIAGCAWVVRDSFGKVLLHSRRAFANIKDGQEAKFKCLLWGIECMEFHRFPKVVLALQDQNLVGVVNRPNAWPSFRFQSQEIQRHLKHGLERKVVVETMSANRGANLIAQSVTNDLRLQSYVAVGFSSWLQGVFEDERVLSSL